MYIPREDFSLLGCELTDLIKTYRSEIQAFYGPDRDEFGVL
jgi:hypothetical protein